MEKMLGIFETGVTVRLTVSTDEICAACPHNAEGSCEAGEKVKAYDRGVLEACGFAEGMEMSFREFAGKVQEKVIDTGIRSKICGDCQWDRICKAAPSKWKKWL